MAEMFSSHSLQPCMDMLTVICKFISCMHNVIYSKLKLNYMGRDEVMWNALSGLL